MFESFNLINFLSLLITLALSVGIHEASHAFTAHYLGDPTPKIQGRLTFNPLAHLDVVGSLVFLMTGRFGWGKPVIINPKNFKKPVRDSAITALAGPVSNTILAILVSPLYKFVRLENLNPLNGSPGFWMEGLETFLAIFFSVNIILAIFNLLPFPPLDGSKILALLIPRKFQAKYQEFLEKGMFYFLAFILIDGFIISDVFGWSILGYVIGNVATWLSGLILIGT